MRINLTDYQAGRTSAHAHAALQQAIAATDRAQHNAVLWFADIMARSLYRELGYASMNQYASEALGFSRTRTGDFMQLAGRLNALPAVRGAVASGELGYTKAREIVKVATPRTEARWVAAAGDCSRRELARKVAAVRRKTARRSGQAELLPAGDAPSLPTEVLQRVGLALTPEQYARWEALWEQAHKRGRAGGDRAEALLQALAAWVDEPGTSNDATTSNEKRCATGARRRAPTVTVHVQRCPDCGKASAPTGRGELRLGRADTERLECDTTVIAPDGRAKSTIPPRIRSRVMARDHHRCLAPGCTHTRFLEVHHVKPRADGGGHDIQNLITLCGACHRLGHERDSGGWRPVTENEGARWSRPPARPRLTRR